MKLTAKDKNRKIGKDNECVFFYKLNLVYIIVYLIEKHV